jgi:hypothetical protein
MTENKSQMALQFNAANNFQKHNLQIEALFGSFVPLTPTRLQDCIPLY